jgi:hypothetical protein
MSRLMYSFFRPSVVTFSLAPRYRNEPISHRPRSITMRFVIGVLAMVLLPSSFLFAGQLTVHWDDNSSNELGFKVERSTNGSTFTTLATVGKGATSFADTTVAAATKYWYRVRAYSLTAYSAYSNVTSATTPAVSSTGTSTTTSIPGRIATFTARAVTGKSTPQPLYLKFSVTGSSKSVLLRGIGPGFDKFTSAKVLPDPRLDLYSGTAGTTFVKGNDNWGGTSLLWSIFNRVGAYGLAGYSKDAALYTLLAVNSYTAIINGSYSGLAQAELYDADIALSPSGHFSKIFARGSVGTGTAILVTGFVVEGNKPIHLLLRAIGPSLTGVTGVLKDPKLSVYHGTTLLKSNDNWGGTSTLLSLFTKVGATALLLTSKDSAIDITLSPGVYSATITSVSGTVGAARLELYDVR